MHGIPPGGGTVNRIRPKRSAGQNGRRFSYRPLVMPRLVLLSVLFLLLLGQRLPAAAAPDAQVPRSDERLCRILVINSYHPGYIWTERLEDAIIARLQEALPRVDVASEYLDWKRNPDQEALQRLGPVMKARYAASPPDLIVTTDDAVVTYALDHRQDYFGNAPIVFCGVSEANGRALLAAHDN